MAFSVDAAAEILRIFDRSAVNFSGIFPFQRDGKLYLVGKEAVAFVDAKVQCSHTFGEHWDRDLSEYISNPFEEKPRTVVDESEKELFALISRSEGDVNSLGVLLRMRKDVRKRDLDDGRVRMVLHGESYHSHKHGYASDGVDVSVMDSRVMVRNEYFDLVRMSELRARESLGESRELSPLPGVSIITQNTLISFPFSTRFDPGRFRRHYEDDSPVIDDSMIDFNRKVHAWNESPYGFYVKILNGGFRSASPEDFSDSYGRIQERLGRLNGVYTLAVKSIVDEANSLHNSLHAEEIERHKSLHERLEESAGY